MSVPGEAMRRQREPHRIRPEFLDDVDRVDHIALGLRHLLPVGIAHQRVDVDLAEWHRILQRARLQPSGIGTSSMKWQPSIIIRATQKNRMSKPVTSNCVG